MRKSLSRSGFFRINILTLALWLLAAASLDGAARAEESLPPEAVAGAELELRGFYAARDMRLAWTKEGEPTPVAVALRDALRGAGAHGLRADEYAVSEIDRRWPGDGKVEDTISFDLLLTGAALRYIAEATSGRVQPESVDPNWSIERTSVLTAALLEQAIGSANPGEALAEMGPLHPGYASLRVALARYQDIAAAGGWPTIPAGATLHPDDRDARIPLLRRRLGAEGYLSPTEATRSDDVLDAPLVVAVQRFQLRHGLETDGVIGMGTLAALNLSVERRIEQIEWSLERWRWLPRYLGDRHILANIPAFSVQLIDGDRVVLESRAIFGRPTRPTPRISAEAVGVLVNPTWTVPPTIFREDVLPQVRQNPGWLAEHNMRVFQGWSAQAAEVDPNSVNWSSVSGTRPPYRIVQSPGPTNALGRIKIEMPNPTGVYLHDTPDHSLFARADRAKSSGCVRIHRIQELASTLLGSAWSPQRLQELISSGATPTIPLARRLKVYLAYIPVVAEADGIASFHPDIYGLDPALAAGLEAHRMQIAASEIDACGNFHAVRAG
jgi:murein L,D-transpeptidase YcbB/YkuD